MLRMWSARRSIPAAKQPELGQPVFQRSAAETQLAGGGGHIAIGGLQCLGVQPALDLGKLQAEIEYILKRIGAATIGRTQARAFAAAPWQS